MSLRINNQYAKKRAIAKNWLLAVRTAMHQEHDQVMRCGATAQLRRRLPTRTCHFRMALQLCGDQVGFQENGPMCAVPSSRLVPKLSACTVRSKSLTKLPESNIPTRVATAKDGFISCMSTHGWLVDRPSRDGQTRRPIVRKRNSPYDHK